MISSMLQMKQYLLFLPSIAIFTAYSSDGHTQNDTQEIVVHKASKDLVQVRHYLHDHAARNASNKTMVPQNQRYRCSAYAPFGGSCLTSNREPDQL
ncbi:hypothetical protein KCTC52924_00425 [Arenibacter antarcticus]